MDTKKDTAEGSTQTTEQTNRLLEVLYTLETRIKRQNSYKNAFLKGLVYGLGTVIGATVLVALFGGMIAATLQTLTGEDINTEILGQ